MARIPKGLTREHVLQALAELDAGKKTRFGLSKTYDLVHEGKRYSPKEVLAGAIAHCTGQSEWELDASGGDATNRPLIRLGFTIEKKSEG